MLQGALQDTHPRKVGRRPAGHACADSQLAFLTTEKPTSQIKLLALARLKCTKGRLASPGFELDAVFQRAFL